MYLYRCQDFKCGDAPILMAARSAEEARIWCSHISTAGLSELSARQNQLREELRQITGRDPLDPFNPTPLSSNQSVGKLLSRIIFHILLSIF